jgi:hypothetical protein
MAGTAIDCDGGGEAEMVAAQLRHYVPGEVLPLFVRIRRCDIANGSPKQGDMIARNPSDHRDQWLVPGEYFRGIKADA